MPIFAKLQQYLDEHHVRYQVATHAEAYTAQEVAQAQHVPGKQMAKVVIVKQEDGTPVMVVLPASYTIDFDRLSRVLGAQAELAQEREFRDLFPGCEVGAEPPFGNLFGVDTLADTALTTDDEIIFNAGSHWQTVRMRYEDFARLVQPRVAAFARHV
jgi:Ala-tRNA(Pro) deacylase